MMSVCGQYWSNEDTYHSGILADGPKRETGRTVRSNVSDGDHGTIWLKSDDIVRSNKEEVLYSVSRVVDEPYDLP